MDSTLPVQHACSARLAATRLVGLPSWSAQPAHLAQLHRLVLHHLILVVSLRPAIDFKPAVRHPVLIS
jgi:hypothetical protein